MKINRTKSGTFIAGLIVLFIIVVLVGRFYFSPTVRDTSHDVYSPPSEVATNTDVTSASSQASRTGGNQTASTSTPDTSSCEEELRAEIATKKQTYAKGQILVTFTPDQVYKNVKDVLAVYGLVVQNEIDSQSSFASRHLVTAAVAPGQEIIKICQLRNDSHIKYAGLDLYFNLHQ